MIHLQDDFNLGKMACQIRDNRYFRNFGLACVDPISARQNIEDWLDWLLYARERMRLLAQITNGLLNCLMRASWSLSFEGALSFDDSHDGSSVGC